MITEEICNSFAAKYFPNDSRYPYTHSADYIRSICSVIKSRSEAASLNLTEVEKRMFAICFMIQRDPLDFLIRLDLDDLSLLQKIISESKSNIFED